MFFRKQKEAVNDNGLDPAPAPILAEEQPHLSASLIASGTSLTGNLDCEGDVIVEGTVRGSLRAMRLTVGLDGTVEGDISADEVTVRGTVKGPIHARHIHLESGATVEGDLMTATIEVDTGARLSGSVWQEQDQNRAERYAPVTASSWDGGIDNGSRSLLAVRPRIIGR